MDSNHDYEDGDNDGNDALCGLNTVAANTKVTTALQQLLPFLWLDSAEPVFL